MNLYSLSSQRLRNDHSPGHVSGRCGQHLTNGPIRCFCPGTLTTPGPVEERIFILDSMISFYHRQVKFCRYLQHVILFVFSFDLKFSSFVGAQGPRREPPRLLVKRDDS